MSYSQLLVLFLGLSLPAAEEGDLLERARKAFELRRELLANYSVEMQSRSLMETPNGRQEFDSLERHYLGDSGEFKRDVISSKRNGVSMDSGGRRAGPGGGRPGNFLPQLPPTDLLTLQNFLDKAEVIGPIRLDSVEAIEIRIQPKIRGFQIKEGRLWVDEDSGMPLRVELQFTMGAFVSDAQLRLDLAWSAEQEITVPRVQRIEMTRGGLGGRRGPSGGNLGRGRGCAGMTDHGGWEARASLTSFLPSIPSWRTLLFPCLPTGNFE